MKGTIRLRSRLLTLLFVSMCIIAVTFTFNTIVGLNDAHADKESNYIEYEVIAGDTMWNIAEKFFSDNTDVRYAVYEICNINNMAANDLQAGQTILIPEEI